ncbi:tRNA (adenosine(37)-N6)-threonylcarbamoyltransferase complex transferase subunit TsaD [Pseudemcibacter aquimaris]|uniref:tRNA (adenosine(37)-N6)-threonylcarbamoyltransferase complex transferase subunit TsaD n=1 Tax=Pseudemcibacter aquimaris TaxID=2857064 RepID=UPI002013B3D5|nr:tRNA (adenosine(37)-N6)-threonylcarbamoyltransferase complex transferase subunit TsaD [Pseudemcibacter aquimaris]MCC3861872.1 tRNA (adenosine(37)-N6)-threonylcarbamoyltransferase complex transferase subunit TsaD [Pseudemcibacter aquimaris]WDU58625.1 tRNA (adenosine(37)-N6)-threonylcarbamoyltransferase complex transferase subunit TsaD [Pseudemcibacter aquimaris]
MTKIEKNLIMGIESSCDETAVAIVSDAGDILSNVILTQLDEHKPYGGVVPEIAARSHIDHLNGLIREAMNEAKVGFDDLSAIAVTSGPGLIGGVMVGLMTAKSIAFARKIPLISVNHLEGHALSIRLTEDVKFPYLLLLVSGGHCQLLVVKGVGDYQRLGTTIDDAAGEAFDKTAKILGLGYPGGPAVEKAALNGDPKRFKFPRPLKGKPGSNFSFSGLKTAVLRARDEVVEENGGHLTKQDVSDLAASFQQALTETILNRVQNGIKEYLDTYPDAEPVFVVAGGVAANSAIKEKLAELCKEYNLTVKAPPMKLCTDNGAMIAWAGVEKFKRNEFADFDIGAVARWPLDPDAPPAVGAGVKA